MGVINIENEEQFSSKINAGNVSVVLFSAEWAEQCKQILDVMNELVKQPNLKDINFLNVPAEELSGISIAQKIEAVPTVLYFRKNAVIDRIDGVDIAALTSKCNKIAGSGDNSKESLETRLKALINKGKVMIFMKGDRNTPRCGFSKQLIGIINETGVDYETFDILTDESVRQGLKTYSDWPTYPQVYVKGELIGGLDIIKELVASSELASTLAG